MARDIAALLGDEAQTLLGHHSETIPASLLHLPGPDYIERVLIDSDRPISVLNSGGLGVAMRHARREIPTR